MKIQFLLFLGITLIASTPNPPIWGGNPSFSVLVNISGSTIDPY